MIPMQIYLKFAYVQKLDIGSGLLVNRRHANSQANCQFGSGDPNRETMSWSLQQVQPVELISF